MCSLSNLYPLASEGRKVLLEWRQCSYLRFLSVGTSTHSWTGRFNLNHWEILMKESMMNKAIEEYKGYRIEIHQVPEGRFDYGAFGWVFRVSQANSACFEIHIRSTGGNHKQSNVNNLLEWGKNRVHAFIDTKSFERNRRYCYKWEHIPTNSSPEEVDCAEFSLGSKC